MFANSFHWDQHQAQGLPAALVNFSTSAFVKARMLHWLERQSSPAHPSSTAAYRRDPSPDGTAEGQYTWFDHTTTYSYCGCGGPTTVANALGQVTTYTYNNAGRLTNRWSVAKGNTAYGYDQAGKLTNVIYAVSPQLRYQYDAANRLTNIIDGVGTTRYTYTVVGNLLTEDSPWASDTVTSAYLIPLAEQDFAVALFSLATTFGWKCFVYGGHDHLALYNW